MTLIKDKEEFFAFMQDDMFESSKLIVNRYSFKHEYKQHTFIIKKECLVYPNLYRILINEYRDLARMYLSDKYGNDLSIDLILKNLKPEYAKRILFNINLFTGVGDGK